MLGNGTRSCAVYTMALEPISAPTPIPNAMPAPSPASSPTALNGNGVISASDFRNSIGSVTHDIPALGASTAIPDGFNYNGLRLGRDHPTHDLSASVDSSPSGNLQDLCEIHSGTTNAAINQTGV